MSVAKVLNFIKEKEAEFVDLRFTDPRGKLQHLTMDSSIVDEDMLNDGVFFDGSLIAFHPAIDEPSKKTPSFNISSSTIEASIVKC